MDRYRHRHWHWYRHRLRRAQVVLFDWKHEQGVAAAKKRSEERIAEKARASAPKEKVVVEEDDIDMFA